VARKSIYKFIYFHQCAIEFEILNKLFHFSRVFFSFSLISVGEAADCFGLWKLPSAGVANDLDAASKGGQIYTNNSIKNLI
jgi:hypothetical protein